MQEFQRPQPSRRELAVFAKEDAELSVRMKNLSESLVEVRRVMREEPERIRDYRPPADLLEEFYNAVA